MIRSREGLIEDRQIFLIEKDLRGFCVGDGVISPGSPGDGDDIAAADDEGEKNLRDCCGVFLCNLLYRDTLKESSAQFSALCQRAVGHGGDTVERIQGSRSYSIPRDARW